MAEQGNNTEANSPSKRQRTNRGAFYNRTAKDTEKRGRNNKPRFASSHDNNKKQTPSQPRKPQERKSQDEHEALDKQGPRSEANNRSPQAGRNQPLARNKRERFENKPDRHMSSEPRSSHDKKQHKGGKRGRAFVESFDDVRLENDRIEKEIWLEIAGIHTIKLD